MREVGDCMTVMPTKEKSFQIAIPITVNRVIRYQRSDAYRSPEDKYDRQWLQAGLRDD